MITTEKSQNEILQEEEPAVVFINDEKKEVEELQILKKILENREFIDEEINQKSYQWWFQ